MTADERKQFQEMIDTSKQGIDYQITKLLVKGYRVLLIAVNDNTIVLRYVNSDGSPKPEISGSSVSDVVGKLYNQVFGNNYKG